MRRQLVQTEKKKSLYTVRHAAGANKYISLSRWEKKRPAYKAKLAEKEKKQKEREEKKQAKLKFKADNNDKKNKEKQQKMVLFEDKILKNYI